jgi:hypothetical protein
METKENQTSPNFKVTGNWEKQSAQLKAKFSQLNDADLKLDDGKHHEMVTRLEKKLEKNHEQVLELLKSTQEENV